MDSPIEFIAWSIVSGQFFVFIMESPGITYSSAIRLLPRLTFPGEGICPRPLISNGRRRLFRCLRLPRELYTDPISSNLLLVPASYFLQLCFLGLNKRSNKKKNSRKKTELIERCLHGWRMRRGILFPYMDGCIIYGLVMYLHRCYPCSAVALS